MRSKIFVSQNTEFLVAKACLIKEKAGKSRVVKQKVTVTSAAIATTKFLFGICDCTADSDDAEDSFSLVLQMPHNAKQVLFHEV